MAAQPLPLARPTSPALSLVAPLPRDLDEDGFRDFIRLHVARQDAAPATVALYVRESNAFREWLDLRGTALRDLTNRNVREWVAELVERRQSPKTIATKLTAVRRLCDAAVDVGVLEKNPTAGVQAPKDKREGGAAAQRVVTHKEVGEILATCDETTAIGERDFAILALLVGQGLRTVEVERLNLGHVDLSAREALVQGKTGERRVFLTGDITRRIAAVIERRLAEGAAPEDAVFVSHGRAARNGKGKRLTRRGIRFIVDRAYAEGALIPQARSEKTGKALNRAAPGKRATRTTGSKVPTTHGLRATFITHARRGGAEFENIAADVGHTDIRTTMRYFALERRRENNSALKTGFEF